MKKELNIKFFRSAAWILLIGVAVSLLICTSIIENNTFAKYLPLWCFIGFSLIDFILEKIPCVANERVLKYGIIISIASIILIIIFYLDK